MRTLRRAAAPLLLCSTCMSTSAEIPQVFTYHVFSCYQQRPPTHPRGSCTAKGAPQLWERLAQRLQSDELPGVAMVWKRPLSA